MTTGDSRTAAHPVTDNQAFVEDFYTKVFVHKNLALIDYCVHKNCVEHNPEIAFRGLAFFLANPAYVVRKVRRIVTTGNFVMVHAEGLKNQRPVTYYDIFTVEEGKIAEHWNAGQEITGYHHAIER
jgi:predicted SnoaL-like aldol condensation-catalyzing enzyme